MPERLQGIPFGLGPEMELFHVPFAKHYLETTNESSVLKIIQFPVLIQKEYPVHSLSSSMLGYSLNEN